MKGDFNVTKGLHQIRDFLRSLTVGQRWLLIAGGLLALATLVVFVALLGNSDYKTLYSGLNTKDAQALGERLKAKNIPFSLSTDGANVLVPADKLDSARLEVASQPLPNSGRMGFELFDKPNWAGSDFSEKVNYQRALEAELERTLQNMSEVESARVHLVLPSDSIYTEQDRTAKASVMVRLKSGRLPEKADTAIRQLVAGAVDRLSPENVVVIDAETNLPLGRSRSGSASGADLDFDQEMAKRVIATLEPVVGPDGVRASVHVEYDLTSGEETQETYDPTSSVALSMTRTEESAGTGVQGGVAGTSSNLPNAKVTVTARPEGNSQSSKSESGTYAVNKLVRHIVQPPGRIKRIAAALLVDDAVEVQEKNGQESVTRRKRNADELKQIESLARAALGIDTSRGDLIAVESLSFQNLPTEQLPLPSRTERLQRSLKNWVWLLRYGALGCLFASVYLLLLRPIKKQILKSFRELPAQISKGAAQAVLPGASLSGNTVDAIFGPSLEDDPSVKKLSSLKKHLVDTIKAEPVGATRLIQGWLHESGVE